MPLRGDAGVVRQTLALAPDSNRRLEERIAVRFPRAGRFLAGLVWRLRPKSRLRKAILRRAAVDVLEAVNRGDFEAAFVLYADDVELVVEPRAAVLGFEPSYRGRDERIRFQQRWNDDWGEFRFEPHELVDLGDRVLTTGRISGSGRSSGASFDSAWAAVVSLSPRGVVREQFFLEHEAARRVAGLHE